MSVFMKEEYPLDNAVLYLNLKKLRYLAYAPYSQYLVASIVEIKISDTEYYYVGGINVENDNHNRLSVHAEQCALSNAMVFLGPDILFSRMWLMAAPNQVHADDVIAPGKSCGHCRQIMLSLADNHAQVIAVSLDGIFSAPDLFESGFLPNAFSKRDLPPAATKSIHNIKDNWKILKVNKHLENTEILQYLINIVPHIISKDFQTSPITACIFKCNNGCYASGVLMQDIAFLTTDAIFSAVANAITQFGKQGLLFDEIHLLTNTFNEAQISGAEIEILSRHVHGDTKVTFHGPDGQCVIKTFRHCSAVAFNFLNEQIVEMDQEVYDLA